jgi:hypothetical protein
MVIYTASTTKQPENRHKCAVTQPEQRRAASVAPSIKRPRFPIVSIDLFDMNFGLILDSVRSGLGHASAPTSRFTKLRARWLHSRGKAGYAYASPL